MRSEVLVPVAPVRLPAGTARGGRRSPSDRVTPAMLDLVTYHMVDRFRDARPPCPGRPAILRYRCHRVPRDGAGGTDPPYRARRPGGAAHPPRAAGDPHAAGHPGDPEERLLRSP